MLSRVAENLHWISRYVERTENVVRLVMDAFQLQLEVGANAEAGVRPLDRALMILHAQEEFQRRKDEFASLTNTEAILRFMTFDRKESSSVSSMIARARENARGVQEALSTEAWSQLNQLYLFLTNPKADQRFQSGSFRFYQKIRKECQLFTAILEGTLPRTEAYHFLMVGRYLERIDMLARMIQAYSLLPLPQQKPTGGSGDDALAEIGPGLVDFTSLLRTCAAFEPYLSHAQAKLDAHGTIGYLLLEEQSPRSMRFAVHRCLESLQAIAGASRGIHSSAERHLGRLESELRYMDIDETLNKGITPFLTMVQEIGVSVGSEIHQAYFRT
jgi:uncharacterized alpha-E superfamily protein